jgi:hypothetical protein
LEKLLEDSLIKGVVGGQQAGVRDMLDALIAGDVIPDGWPSWPGAR